ncbi:isochorismatase family protein [Mycobacterium seoulense]|uniref:isochorismatase family protein n=1 Tax=Mycobacterium seoulense TaxID=386911 RepID=UPI003CF185D7
MHAIDRRRIAVLCVECQTGVLGPDSVLPLLAQDCPRLVTDLQRLLDAARIAGVHVVHATYEGACDTETVGTARIWRVLAPATADWEPSAPATQVMSELLAPSDVVVPRRHGLFPTLDTDLLAVLRGLGVDTVVLAGVSLNLALPVTAAHLSDAGFHLIVARDAVAGTPPDYGQQVLTHTMAKLGRLTTIDELIGSWTVDVAQPGRSS